MITEELAINWWNNLGPLTQSAMMEKYYATPQTDPNTEQVINMYIKEKDQTLCHA